MSGFIKNNEFTPLNKDKGELGEGTIETPSPTYAEPEILRKEPLS